MTSQSTQSPSNVPNAWGVACRPTLLFVAAYALSITPHEAVHAFTSYLLGFSSTLFQMWVNPDPARATSRQLATIAAAGPVFSLAVGVTCWLLYQRRFRRKPAALMFLMLAMVGVYSFLGPLAGSALGGDFNLAFMFPRCTEARSLCGVGNRIRASSVVHVLHGREIGGMGTP